MLRVMISNCGEYVLRVKDQTAKILTIRDQEVKQYYLQDAVVSIIWEPVSSNSTKVAVVGISTVTILMVHDYSEDIKPEPIIINLAGLRISSLHWISPTIDEDIALRCHEDFSTTGGYQGAVQLVVITEFNTSAHLFSLCSPSCLLTVENPVNFNDDGHGHWQLVYSDGATKLGWFANVGGASIGTKTVTIKEYNQGMKASYNPGGSYWIAVDRKLAGIEVDIYKSDGDYVTYFSKFQGVEYDVSWVDNSIICTATVDESKLYISVFSMEFGRLVSDISVNLAVSHRIWQRYDRFAEERLSITSTTLVGVYGGNGFFVVVLDREVFVYEWVSSLSLRAIIATEDSAQQVVINGNSVFFRSGNQIIEFCMGMVKLIFEGHAHLKQMVVAKSKIIVLETDNLWHSLSLNQPVDLEQTDTFIQHKQRRI